jgi:hypothetical protein
MLNPVGIVDAGRISQDTGHSFDASRDAASGIAARYYMNRNFFIADPDAFTVSTQTVDDQSWHGGQRPLTLDEARVSIALAAVSGGMFEIGDDLPTLGASPERLSLVKNRELIDMARLGHASTPVDLMSYEKSDRQPCIFLLRENPRQSILTIFNWTDQERSRAVDFKRLGLKEPGQYQIVDVFGEKDCCSNSSGAIHLVQKPHSVRMLKLIDDIRPRGPTFLRGTVGYRSKGGGELDLQRGRVIFRGTGACVPLGLRRRLEHGRHDGASCLHSCRRIRRRGHGDGFGCSHQSQDLHGLDFRRCCDTVRAGRQGSLRVTC